MLLLAILAVLSSQVCAQHWTVLEPTGEAPPARGNSAAVYDPVDHRLIVFGGRVSGGELDDVWELDLNAGRWQDLTPSAGPAPTPRWSHNAVYDPAGHRMLVWSGRQGGTFYNDVWALDLDEHTWTELVASDPLPNPRYGTAAILDPLAGVLVNFAGFTDEGRFQDTWRFDPNNAQWSQLSPETDPGPRCLHSAVYDRRAHRMLIYGGQRGSGRLADLWALDLGAGEWSELTPGSAPAGRKRLANPPVAWQPS